MYIGEGDPVGTRLEDHYRAKAFWEKALFFTADTRLNKAHIQHIEARLVKLAFACNVSGLENGNQPQPPALGEEEYAFAENVLADLLLMLPLLGFEQFQANAPASDSVYDETNDSSAAIIPRRSAVYSQLSRGMVFHQKYKEANANLEIVEGGIAIKKGSTIVREPVPSFETYCAGLAQMRRQLLESGVIAEDKGKLVFTQDQFFSSASAAASLIKGVNSNADNWVSNDGKDLGDLLRELKKKST